MSYSSHHRTDAPVPTINDMPAKAERFAIRKSTARQTYPKPQLSDMPDRYYPKVDTRFLKP